MNYSFHPKPYEQISTSVEDPESFVAALCATLRQALEAFPGDTNFLGACTISLLEVLEDQTLDPVDQLVKTYGSWGEHPRFCRANWRAEVADNQTNLGYWDWILQQEEIFGGADGDA